MTMTNPVRTLFEMPPALPEIGTYIAVGQAAGKVLRYNANKTEVTVEQWLQGTKHEKTYAVDALNPQPVDAEPVVARQAYEVVIEANTPEEVTLIERKLRDVLKTEGIQTQTIAAPAAVALTVPQWEIKILRQVIDSGDQDHHELELAGLMNDGWEILSMKSSRIKGRAVAMLVVIYLRRQKTVTEPTEAAAEAVENVSSAPVDVRDLNEPGAVATMLTEYFTEHPDDVPPEETPEPAAQAAPPSPIDPMSLNSFDEALAAHDAGLITMEQVLEVGDRQAMTAGRDTFISLSMARQEQMSMLNLPMLPLPDRITA